LVCGLAALASSSPVIMACRPPARAALDVPPQSRPAVHPASTVAPACLHAGQACFHEDLRHAATLFFAMHAAAGPLGRAHGRQATCARRLAVAGQGVCTTLLIETLAMTPTRRFRVQTNLLEQGNPSASAFEVVVSCRRLHEQSLSASSDWGVLRELPITLLQMGCSSQ